MPHRCWCSEGSFHSLIRTVRRKLNVMNMQAPEIMKQKTYYRDQSIECDRVHVFTNCLWIVCLSVCLFVCFLSSTFACICVCLIINETRSLIPHTHQFRKSLIIECLLVCSGSSRVDTIITYFYCGIMTILFCFVSMSLLDLLLVARSTRDSGVPCLSTFIIVSLFAHVICLILCLMVYYARHSIPRIGIRVY